MSIHDIPAKRNPVEGSVSWGTLRPQDLLRAFATELEGLNYFNCFSLREEARGYADILDSDTATDTDHQGASEVIDDLVEQLNIEGEPHGLWFGSLDGDGSDYGFWRIENEDA